MPQLERVVAKSQAKAIFERAPGFRRRHPLQMSLSPFLVIDKFLLAILASIARSVSGELFQCKTFSF